VHLFISGGFLVTARRGACAELDLLRGRLQLGTDEPEDYFVYRILDGLTDAYYPLITETEERIDALESEVLTRPRPGQLERIYRLKQQVQAHQRHVTAQRDAFPAAVEAILALPTLSHGTRPYLRDVADHLAQVAAELQRQAGDLTSLTETFFNANANKLNESAARLSVIATFFVVGTLVTGFFGQNFGWLVSHIESRTDFLLLGVAGPLALLGALSAYFWRRRGDWL
jgi:magnesium transporter